MKFQFAMLALMLPLISIAEENLYSVKWTPAARHGYATYNLYNDSGVMVNNGVEVSYELCELSDPVTYYWGTSQVGYELCYGKTSTGLIINDGAPFRNKCAPKPSTNTCN